MIRGVSDEDWAIAGDRNIQDLFRFELVAGLTLKPNSTFIDVGANRGDYLKIASKYCSPKNIHAFEPIDFMARYLERSFPEINIHQYAVGNANHITTFNLANFDELSGLRMRALDKLPSGTTFSSVESKVVALDDYLKRIKNLDLVKIDVEGGEIDVLIGMNKILEKFKPIIFIEHGIEGPEYFGHGPGDFWRIVKEHKYEIFTADGQNIVNRETFEDSFYNWPIWNYVLIAKNG